MGLPLDALGMEGAKALGPATGAHWTATADHVAVRIAAPAGGKPQ